MTVENDIVLIYMEDKPMTFARVESIEADHKPDWYHVKLLLLQIPLQVVTWILRDVYIEGEPYSMGGKTMRLEKVTCPPDPDSDDEDTTSEDQAPSNGNVISLADLKKK